MKNLYSDPDYKELIMQMKAQLKQAREELGETDKKYPAIQRIINENWSK